MIKQRQESVELYDKGGRAGARRRRSASEIEIITAYLPQADVGRRGQGRDRRGRSRRSAPQSMKDMGKVMAALKEAHAGKMDFGKASGLVKSLLAG